MNWEWRRWYAWRPVWTKDEGWIWLTRVWRKRWCNLSRPVYVQHSTSFKELYPENY